MFRWKIGVPLQEGEIVWQMNRNFRCSSKALGLGMNGNANIKGKFLRSKLTDFFRARSTGVAAAV
jgi:hypothetical protein